MVLEGHRRPWGGAAERLKWAWQQHTLGWTLAVSVLLHGALMTWRLADPGSFQRVFDNTALEVVLVNARSDPDAENAQALAQVHLAGGGHHAGASMASSPLPPSNPTEEGSDMASMNRQLAAMQLQQMRLLSQLRQELAQLAQLSSATHKRLNGRPTKSDSKPWPDNWRALSNRLKRPKTARKKGSSALRPARPFSLCITTNCGARSKPVAPKIFRK
jgi:hypothetical protein